MSAPHFDPMSAAFAQDPYSVYATLREHGMFYAADMDMWLVSRHADIATLTQSPHAVRSLNGYVSDDELRTAREKANFHDMPFHEKYIQSNLLDSDGPNHRRLRKAVFGAFTGRSLQRLEPYILSCAETRLSALKERDNFDFITDFARPIPAQIIAAFLGVPPQDAAQLGTWSENIVSYFDIDRTSDKKAVAEANVKSFHAYLSDLITVRRRAPKDDLISQFIHARSEGEMSEDELISTCMLILMAGHGSSIDALGNGMAALLNHPTAANDLRNNPILWPNAINEMLRYDAPLPFFHRHIIQDADINGHVFPTGTTFGLLYGAANRDPTLFENPDTFDISRHPNRHLAFGRGAHLCLGNHLARLNLHIIFDLILSRYDNFQLSPNGLIYKHGLAARGPQSLNMSWQKRG